MSSIERINADLEHATADAFQPMIEATRRAAEALRVFGAIVAPAFERHERLRWQMKRKGRPGWKRGPWNRQ